MEQLSVSAAVSAQLRSLEGGRASVGSSGGDTGAMDEVDDELPGFSAPAGSLAPGSPKASLLLCGAACGAALT